MKIFFSTFLILLNIQAKAQNNYPIPKDYVVFKDNITDKPFQLSKDLDNDGINDLVAVYNKSNSDNDQIIAIYLSSIYNSTNTYYYFPLFSNNYDLNFKNNILSIGYCNGLGRLCKTLKFRFDPTLKNMRLIGYEEESFGNVSHEGAYVKSINLLTNKYQITKPNVKNKILKTAKFQVITLQNINKETFDSLEKLGADYE